MLEARKRNLPGDGLTGALVAAYGQVWATGDMVSVEKMDSTLCGRVERLCREHDGRALDVLRERVARACGQDGRTAVLVASARRQMDARMRYLGERVDRTRRQPGSVA